MARMDEVAVSARKQQETVWASGRATDFEVFFEEQHERLFRALWLLTRNRHEAEEVMQDAFLRLWERWDRVIGGPGGPDPVGYLYRTAMNVWRSRLRRAAVAARKAIHHIQDDDEIAEVEERDAVVRALAPLPPRQRAAIVLMDVLDLSSERAGEVLGIRPVTVRVLAARARGALAKEMGKRHG
jgi:RNA polymerase sigma-70 factor (ECF subfamily)